MVIQQNLYAGNVLKLVKFALEQPLTDALHAQQTYIYIKVHVYQYARAPFGLIQQHLPAMPVTQIVSPVMLQEPRMTAHIVRELIFYSTDNALLPALHAIMGIRALKNALFVPQNAKSVSILKISNVLAALQGIFYLVNSALQLAHLLFILIPQILPAKNAISLAKAVRLGVWKLNALRAKEVNSSILS